MEGGQMGDGRRFSERAGVVPAKPIQDKSVDGPLKNLLWNETQGWLKKVEWYKGKEYAFPDDFCRRVWEGFFKQRLDELEPLAAKEYPKEGSYAAVKFLLDRIRTFFFDDNTPWYELLDLIELLLTIPCEKFYEREQTINRLNRLLEQERSAYRLVEGRFVPITSEVELKAVERAIKPASTALATVATHMQQALKLFADRKAPDYRNSMKESISAVESLCKSLARMPYTTLGPALDKTAKELGLNGHLREGFKSIYKYTSDDHGIRHGLKDDDHPEEEDAMLMLVTCSAFVNFVTEKARKQRKLLI
jgi:hypothetical protein